MFSDDLSRCSHNSRVLHNLAALALLANVDRQEGADEVKWVGQEGSSHSRKATTEELRRIGGSVSTEEVFLVKIIKEELECSERGNPYHVDPVTFEETIHALLLPHVHERTIHRKVLVLHHGVDLLEHL